MDKQIIEISKDGFYLSLNRGFLVVENDELNIKQQISLDNILSLVISANNATISKNIIKKQIVKINSFIKVTSNWFLR